MTVANHSNEASAPGLERTATDIENGMRHARTYANGMERLAVLLRKREELESDIAETRKTVARAGAMIADHYQMDENGRALR